MGGLWHCYTHICEIGLTLAAIQGSAFAHMVPPKWCTKFANWALLRPETRRKPRGDPMFARNTTWGSVLRSKKNESNIFKQPQIYINLLNTICWRCLEHTVAWFLLQHVLRISCPSSWVQVLVALETCTGQNEGDPAIWPSHGVSISIGSYRCLNDSKCFRKLKSVWYIWAVFKIPLQFHDTGWFSAGSLYWIMNI